MNYCFYRPLRSQPTVVLKILPYLMQNLPSCYLLSTCLTHFYIPSVSSPALLGASRVLNICPIVPLSVSVRVNTGSLFFHSLEIQPDAAEPNPSYPSHMMQKLLFPPSQLTCFCMHLCIFYSNTIMDPCSQNSSS